jgi:hypothetical protein
MDASVARSLHRLIEPCHAFVYFAPEASVAYAEAGLKGQRMAYFASRAAAMGPVGPEVVVATFYGFAPSAVGRAIPDAWDFAPPERVLSARFAAADQGLRRMLGGRAGGAELREAAELSRCAAEAATCSGRPLAAAHQGLEWPDEPHLVLWHAASILREHRGDGHVSVLVSREIGPREAMLTYAGVRPGYGDFARATRGWSDDEIAEAEESLRVRGLLDESGGGTPACVALRDEIEAETDRLALQPYRAIGEERCERLAAALAPIAAAVRGR